MTSTEPGAVRAEVESMFKSDPTPFPDDDASELQTWGEDVDWWVMAGTALPGSPTAAMAASGVTFADLAKEAIDIVKSILGDPGLAMGTALAWAEAADQPSAISTNLANEKVNLSSYWEGGAYDAFAGYLDLIIGGVDSTGTRLADMAKNIATTYSLVMDTYETAITFIGDCASSLIALAALPLSLMDAAELIKSFADAIFDLQDSSIAIMNDYRAAIIALQIDAITFPTLTNSANVLDRIDDTDDWDVRPD
jgi:hypothetical protein